MAHGCASHIAVHHCADASDIAQFRESAIRTQSSCDRYVGGPVRPSFYSRLVTTTHVDVATRRSQALWPMAVRR